MIGFPDIPDYKGIVPAGIDALVSFGGGALINTLFGNYWGIFSEIGVPIILVDNVVSLNHKNTSRISQAPVEKGSFTSYNKVSDPSNITLQITKGSGGVIERGAFLAELETLQKSTLKFYVITPEYVYKNYNLRDIDTARSADDGATLLKVNLHLEEVRESIPEYSQSPSNPEDQPIVDTGSVDATW